MRRPKWIEKIDNGLKRSALATPEVLKMSQTVFSFVFASLCIYWLGAPVFRYFAVLNWIDTDAKITQLSYSDDYKAGKYHAMERVDYDYWVDGKKISARTVFHFLDKGVCEQIVKGLKVGSVVKIAYNPKEPTRSTPFKSQEFIPFYFAYLVTDEQNTAIASAK